MPELVMAIDAGTTGIKALVLDPETSVRGHAYSEFAQSYPRPGWVEHDPVEIWETTRGVMQASLADAGAQSRDLAAIGITDQRETTVLWGRAKGEPVGPALVWQDRRTADICARLRGEGLEDEIHKRTGLVLDPYFSATKLMWCLDNIEGLRGRTEGGEIAFGTIDSWLIYKLTGHAVHATEASNASRTLLYSLDDRGWDGWILERLGIPEAVLPEIRPSSGRFGLTAAGVLEGAEVPISGVAGDQQAALFGQACFEPGMAKNTYGTGSFVLMNTGSEPQRSERGLLASAGWDLGGEMTFVLEGSIFITGAAVQWLRDGLEIIASAAEVGPLAASVDDTAGVYVVPAFVGLGAPHWDPYARGAVLGITRGTSRAHIARAVVESMAYQTRDVIEAMRADSPAPVTELRVDGGASVMDLLCQLQADQLGVVVRRPENLETTALGSAYLAGLAEGVWASPGELHQRWAAAAEFEPRAARAEADELYAGWQKAVERAKDWARD